MHGVENVLAGWESFYVIVGSSAAALTGLQFVVIALVAETARRGSAGQFGAFATPTVVHFSGVLLTSAVVSAPWPTLNGIAVFLVAEGLLGVGYSVLVAVRARRQSGYAMVKEDWTFHVILPFIGYAASAGAGAAIVSRPVTALFVTAAIQVLILFVGIHNAWDTATYITLEHIAKRERPGSEQASGSDGAGTAEGSSTAATIARG